GLFLVGAVSSFFYNASYAFWLIIQAKMSRAYPYPYSSTALMCVMAARLSVTFTFCVERDLSQWKLGLNVRLLTVAYDVCPLLVALLYSNFESDDGCDIVVPIHESPLILMVVAFDGSTILDKKLYLE
ncbi:hypothetical protein S245_013785, partial [Arachis hypogaea]